jgi:polar amino acid transport system permease protein
MRHHSHLARHKRSRIKPSYLVLLALVPLFIYLYIFDATYQSALRTILPGLGITIILTFTGYLLAFIWGLLLAGLQFLKRSETTVRNFLVVSSLLTLGGLSLLLLPQQGYVLIGEAEGTVGILSGTPRALSDAVRQGTYAEDAPPRQFRSVASAEVALERIAAGTYTGALLPAEAVPDDANILWETSIMPTGRRNLMLFLSSIGIFLLLLTFGSWQSSEHPLAIFAELYIDIVRGIPMIVLIVFIGLVLPGVLGDFRLEPTNETLRNLQRGTLAIGFAYAAYMAEIFRAGIRAVPRGQIEAARSLGLSGWQSVRFIILPQALKIVIPPLGNEFIAMLKDTALVSYVGTGEIFRLARQFGAATLNNIPPFQTAAVLYIILTLGASSMLKWLERRTGVSDKR